MNINPNPTSNKNENKNKNQKCLSSDDDEMQYSRASGERRRESGTGSGDGDPSVKEKRRMQPRVVLEEMLLDTKLVMKTRPGPQSRKKEMAAFGNIKPNASSPPPPPGMDATTEEEEKRGSSTRPSSPMETATDIANLSDFSVDSAASIRTAASGASKRTKKLVTSKPKRVRSKEEYQDRSSSSEEEENSLMTRKKKGRGRPVTTGEGVEILARQAAKKELQNLEKEKQNIEKILEGGFDPSEYRGGRQSKRMEDMEEEMQNLPSKDIAAQMAQAAKQVELVAVKSGNLKGAFVKILKEAVLKITVGTDALICRSLPKENENAREMERLREEIRTLRDEMEKLRAQRDQELMPPPSSQEIIEREHPPNDRMEIDEEEKERKTSLRYTHPSKDKWPAIRPAIQGITKILSDEEEDNPAPSRSKQARERPSSEGNLRKTTEMSVEKILSDKFKELSSQISLQIKEEVGRFLPTLVGKTSPLSPTKGVPDRARINAPNTSAPMRDAGERPVPARKGKGGKGRNERRTETTTMTSRDVTLMEGNNKITATPSKDGSKSTLLVETKKNFEEPWAKVVGRKARDKTERKKTTEKETNKEATKKMEKGPSKTANSVITDKGKAGGKKPRRRIPKTAAITLTCPKGQYAETMAEVRAKINLSEVGIQDGITTRTAATGALLIEVPGSENGPKADALASRMREVLKDREGVKVNRPVKTADVRVRGLECSIRKEEVIEAVAEKAMCWAYEIQTGEIRGDSENQKSLWLKLPLVAAKKATEGGTLRVGWTKAKIELLDARPLRCYKCLERGHVQEKCPNPQDRSDRCYRCGSTGHVARECRDQPKCPICMDQGRKADHILGSQQCTPLKKRGRNGEVGKQGMLSHPPPAEKAPTTEPETKGLVDTKPQRPARNRERESINAPSTSSHQEEEAMETEPLEEGGNKGE